MAFVRGIDLFLKHAFIDRAHGVLGTAEYDAADFFRMFECELRNVAAHRTRDCLGAAGDFVAVFGFAPLGCTVRVTHRHANDRNRSVNSGDRPYARQAPSGTDDHLAVDSFAQDAIWRTDVALLLGRNRGGLETELRATHRTG